MLDILPLAEQQMSNKLEETLQSISQRDGTSQPCKVNRRLLYEAHQQRPGWKAQLVEPSLLAASQSCPLENPSEGTAWPILRGKQPQGPWSDSVAEHTRSMLQQAAPAFTRLFKTVLRGETG